jgi:hypothetical protein
MDSRHGGKFLLPTPTFGVADWFRGNNRSEPRSPQPPPDDQAAIVAAAAPLDGGSKLAQGWSADEVRADAEGDGGAGGEESLS